MSVISESREVWEAQSLTSPAVTFQAEIAAKYLLLKEDGRDKSEHEEEVSKARYGGGQVFYCWRLGQLIG